MSLLPKDAHRIPK